MPTALPSAIGTDVSSAERYNSSSVDNPEKISAVLIALDEEHNIGAALESVAWANKVLVGDGGSSDKTRQRCEELGARVVERRFTTYAEQKNFALDEASHDWVLSLDADERASSSLTSHRVPTNAVAPA